MWSAQRPHNRPSPSISLAQSNAVSDGAERIWVVQPVCFPAFPESHCELTTSHKANLPDDSLPAMSNVTQTGVYFGYAQIPAASEGHNGVLPMVMSLGYNPFYKNKQLTAVRACAS